MAWRNGTLPPPPPPKKRLVQTLLFGTPQKVMRQVDRTSPTDVADLYTLEQEVKPSMLGAPPPRLVQRLRSARKRLQSAALVQATVRRRQQRLLFLDQKASAIKLQAQARTAQARAELEKHRRAISKIGALRRGQQARAQLKEAKQAAARVQATARGRQQQQEYRLQKAGAIKMQAATRRSRQKKVFNRQKGAALSLSSAARRRTAQKTLKEAKAAATALQTKARGRQASQLYAAQRASARRISAAARGKQQREVYKGQRAAALQMQTSVRVKLGQRAGERQEVIVGVMTQVEHLLADHRMRPIVLDRLTTLMVRACARECEGEGGVRTEKGSIPIKRMDVRREYAKKLAGLLGVSGGGGPGPGHGYVPPLGDFEPGEEDASYERVMAARTLQARARGKQGRDRARQFQAIQMSTKQKESEARAAVKVQAVARRRSAKIEASRRQALRESRKLPCGATNEAERLRMEDAFVATKRGLAVEKMLSYLNTPNGEAILRAESHRQKAILETQEKAWKELSKEYAAEERLRYIFDAYDTDGSGEIDMSEFMHLTAELKIQLTSKELDAAFARLDEDGSGALSFSEFRVWFQANDPSKKKNRRRRRHLKKLAKTGESLPTNNEFDSLEFALARRALVQNIARSTEAMARKQFQVLNPVIETTTGYVDGPPALKPPTKAVAAKYSSVWAIFDEDGDGELTAREVSKACAEMGFNQLDALKMIRKHDLNGSGTLNFAEFCVMMEAEASVLQSIAQRRLIKKLTLMLRKLTHVVERKKNSTGGGKDRRRGVTTTRRSKPAAAAAAAGIMDVRAGVRWDKEKEMKERTE